MSSLIQLACTLGFMVTLYVRTVRSVGCFVCTSFNYSNPECEDPFQNRNNRFYQSKCWSSHRNRIGVFPATQCIKMVATDYETGYRIVVRNCVVDNGGTTSESEIGRQSHCGWVRTMKYNNKMYHGCLLACDYDGCNLARPLHKPVSIFYISLVLFWSVFIFYTDWDGCRSLVIEGFKEKGVH